MIILEDRKQPFITEAATFMIAERPIEPGQLDARHILKPEELADRLKVDVTWVYENTRKRASVRKTDPLPSIRMGKYLRFYWPVIEKWLERHQGGQANALASRRVYLAQGLQLVWALVGGRNRRGSSASETTC